MNHLVLTVSKRRDFLLALLRTGSPTRAAQSAGVSRETCYTLKARDAAFRTAWLSAQAVYGTRPKPPSKRKAYDHRRLFSETKTAAEYDALVASGTVKPYEGYLGPMAAHRED